MIESTKTQADRAGWGGKFGRPETWAEFDALPRGLKRVYWDAAYSYTAIDAVMAVRAGLDLRRFASVVRQLQQRDVRREARRVYGGSHPQAVRS